MPASRNRPVRRFTENRIRSALCILTLGMTLGGLAGCRSPLGGQAGLKAELSLSFIVSGAERLTRDASAQRYLNPESSASIPDGTSTRLLLPTAASLEVTLTPEAGGDTINAEPVQIVAGTATVPVSLSAVPYGSYIVKAEAKDASGGIRFSQIALLTVGDPELSVTLNLVPTDLDGAALAATTLNDIDIAELPAGQARTWLVAPGSRLLAARSIFLSGLGSDTRVYLQMADGTLVSDPLGTGTRLSTVGLPAGEPAYLTVYNGGTGAQPASRAFPGPAMVDVPAGAFQRDATSADNVSHVSAFSMADLEVTRELYLAVMGADPSDIGVSTGPAHPVHRISWYQALAFCNKLSLIEKLKPVYSVLVNGSPIDWSSLDPGTIPTTSHTDWNAATLDAGADGYRLPRAMEWLWAAMGATSGSRYSGGVNTIGYNRLFAGSDGTNSEAFFSWRDTVNTITMKAGSYSSNELGLYDMSGNVRELVWDWFESNVPPGSLHDYSGPSINPNGSDIFRTWVGTCYNSGPWELNMRSTYNAFGQDAQAGFRVARGSLPTYTITYYANGATSGTAPASLSVFSGKVITIEGNPGNLVGSSVQPGIFQRFIGWNTKPDGSGSAYSSNSVFTVNDNYHFYAIFTTDASPVGKIGPAGGLIFYDAGSIQTDAAGTWQYMEVAPASTEFVNIWWHSTAEFLNQGFDKYLVGEGKQNSSAIDSFLSSQGQTNRAAQVCESLVFSGYDDWYLPTHDELKHVYLNVHARGLGGFSVDQYDARYWSCSEYSNGAFYINFTNTYSAITDFQNDSFSKPSNLRVRAVRRF